MKSAIFWFRRDLRLADNHGLFSALTQSETVYPLFVFDSMILDHLNHKSDRRVQLIWDAVMEIQDTLQKTGRHLTLVFGDPVSIIPQLAKFWDVSAVFANRDYEPYAIERDQKVASHLSTIGIEFRTEKDHVIFEKTEVMKEDDSPYVVYTPYSKKWKSLLTDIHFQNYVTENLLHKVTTSSAIPENIKIVNTITDSGFNPVEVSIKGTRADGLTRLSEFSTRIQDYNAKRDFPAQKGVSYLSPYLRFGMVSVRECLRMALKQESIGSSKWINELIWRDFYSQILFHFPHAAETAFNPVYKNLDFPNDENKFDAWCQGQTGFPIVDAAMRQLNSTGWMHNRLRMIAASFLVKDLHIDWRWGEQYFASLLLDFDLASNNGGWQWAASTGCDAQPYFRIFNPQLQSAKFDPEGHFIKKYCPELSRIPPAFIHDPTSMTLADQKRYDCIIGRDYPARIVNHFEARDIALQLFKSVS